MKKGLLSRLLRASGPGPRSSPGEALEDAARLLAEQAPRLYRGAVEAAEEALEALRSRGLLHRVEQAKPGRLYGVDGGMARARLGSRLLVALHAAAVGPGELHMARLLLVPGSGPEAEEAAEAAMVMLETLVLAEAARRDPGAVYMLDGPLADPPWVPGPSRSLEEAASQLLPGMEPGEALEALTGLHEARAEALGLAETIGVVKRLTGERLLAETLGVGRLGDDHLAAAVSALLRRRGHRVYAAGPLRLSHGVYRVYEERGLPVYTAYVLDARWIPVAYRVEAAGEPGKALKAAALAVGATAPGSRLPAPILAAHRAAQVAGRVLALARRLIAGAAPPGEGELLAFLDLGA